jgi:uroporphyrinogen decarboxylase
MNSKERVFLKLEGKQTDRLPNLNILMQFAAREIGAKYSEFCRNHEKLVQGNIVCAEKYGIDCVTTMSDPMREGADLGMDVIIPEDDVPYSEKTLIRDKADLLALRPRASDEGTRKYETIEAIRMYKKELGNEYPVVGWVEGCFAQAADLRGVNEFLFDLMDDMEFSKDLLDFCLEQELMYAREQIEAGADIVGLGDAIASVAGPKLYRELARDYESRILKAIREMGAKTKLHICGDIGPFLADIPAEYCDIVDVDWMVDLEEAVRILGGTTCVSGNYDPVAVMLQGTTKEIDSAVRVCAGIGGKNYISAAGCEVPKFTPEENLLQVQKTIAQL